MAIIYIHIGTHKTGSTAIQETLRINKKLLKKNNCMLLRIKGLCDRILKMDSFDINRLDIEKNNVKRTIKKAKCDNIILSCENLSGNVMNAYMDNELIARSLKYIFSCCVSESSMPIRSWRYFQAREKMLSLLATLI